MMILSRNCSKSSLTRSIHRLLITILFASFLMLLIKLMNVNEQTHDVSLLAYKESSSIVDVGNNHDNNNNNNREKSVNRFEKLCLIKFPSPVQQHAHNSTWISITLPKYRIYSFSAYYLAGKNNGDVIMYVISNTTALLVPFCLLWDADEEHHVVRAFAEMNKNSFNNLFREYRITCLSSRISQLKEPRYVSLIENKCKQPNHVVDVVAIDNQQKQISTLEPHNQQQLWWHKSPKVNFSICVSPLNQHYDKYERMLEWIELNRMFGVEYFFFYNFSTGSKVEKVLNYYVNENLATIIQWKLPVKVDERTGASDVHYYGQLTALNDCLMRSRLTSHFVVNIDLDEFIVPTKDRTFYQLFTDVFKDKNVNISNVPPVIMSIRNTFFRVQQCNNTNNLFTNCSTKREDLIFRHGSRSKWMASSEVMDLIGVHGPQLKNIRQNRVIKLEPDVALVFHYHEHEEWIHPMVAELRMQTFSIELASRLQKMLTQVT
ncbi:hypothetical protein HELRODRAFT_180975 [Helobdella robusta]|uniref:Glycosyltransferase family 92 protein n=1 Tax=Helobdella robusta TaxID=6412 RepID=T1FGH2_HELRO|nr:hypothetical protein HELRODRAFT_180975 [Helobdella robusta]ESN93436.1 hypothetical protein HELRODRAFT_180975 [Helobdella robusta]